MKRSALRRKPRPRKGLDELERMAAFKAAADAQGCCQVCGGPADVAHHVVTQQHVRRENGDPWDPRLAMALCDADHDAHHNRSAPIPGPCVPSAAGKFAIELLGKERAVAYFERLYDCSHSRLEPSPRPVDCPS